MFSLCLDEGVIVLALSLFSTNNNGKLNNIFRFAVKKHGLDSLTPDVVGMVSHATQERLRNLLEKLSTISLHRVEIYKVC